ncbi:hypothetical protein SBC1_81220 (plasmid) [Caballeronia sp. SBC1]|nr:hypothetical protein SBC1_81220 [Caballeronia sp. SBC1]
MKPAWSRVQLRVSGWSGPGPVGGDEVLTGTGRRYQIVEVKAKAVVCLVLPRDAPVQGQVFNWVWDRRGAKR